MARLSDEEIKERLSGLEAWQRTISSHSEGGLTENDLELAREVHQLA